MDTHALLENCLLQYSLPASLLPKMQETVQPLVHTLSMHLNLLSKHPHCRCALLYTNSKNGYTKWFLDPSDGVFGRFDLVALCGCPALNVCLFACYLVPCCPGNDVQLLSCSCIVLIWSLSLLVQVGGHCVSPVYISDGPFGNW